MPEGQVAMAKRRNQYRMTRKRYMRMCFNEYKKIMGVDEVDVDAFSDWMLANGKYEDRPDTMKQRCKRDLTRALSEERTLDEKGRVVRANHCIKVSKGEMLFDTKWFNIYEAKPGRMRVSLATRLRQMEAQVHQHYTDWSSYNDFNQ